MPISGCARRPFALALAASLILLSAEPGLTAARPATLRAAAISGKVEWRGLDGASLILTKPTPGLAAGLLTVLEGNALFKVGPALIRGVAGDSLSFEGGSGSARLAALETKGQILVGTGKIISTLEKGDGLEVAFRGKKLKSLTATGGEVVVSVDDGPTKDLNPGESVAASFAKPDKRKADGGRITRLSGLVEIKKPDGSIMEVKAEGPWPDVPYGSFVTVKEGQLELKTKGLIARGVPGTKFKLDKINPTAVEYGVMLGLIIVVCIAVISFPGPPAAAAETPPAVTGVLIDTQTGEYTVTQGEPVINGQSTETGQTGVLQSAEDQAAATEPVPSELPAAETAPPAEDSSPPNPSQETSTVSPSAP